MRKTAIMKDDLFMEHEPGADHVESPDRLRVIYEQLDKPEIRQNFLFPSFAPVGKDIIGLNHNDAHFNLVAATAGKSFDMLDPDTTTSAKSFDAGCLAVGALVEGARLLAEGEIDNCFALVRPPGHHAESDRSMGFCLFNNVAIAARYAVQKLKMERVLIIDWDLHHGNGTQHSFEDDPSILYFSTHQYPYYPGSGSFSESGRGKGEGFTVNVPLSMGYGDGEYVGIFEKIFKPIALEFGAEIILVSAGFDIYMGDPLGGMDVTPSGFAALTRSIMEIADSCCGGKVVITLEGGYNLQGLRDSVMTVLKELAGLSKTSTTDLLAKADQQTLDPVVKRVNEVHHRYWKSL